MHILASQVSRPRHFCISYAEQANDAEVEGTGIVICHKVVDVSFL